MYRARILPKIGRDVSRPQSAEHRARCTAPAICRKSGAMYRARNLPNIGRDVSRPYSLGRDV
jgi:hypothetical protein